MPLILWLLIVINYNQTYGMFYSQKDVANPNSIKVERTDLGGSVLSGPNKVTPADAANSINTVAFLQDLVRLKDTVDEIYYQEKDSTAGMGGEREDVCQASNLVSVVEYTGKLWFLRKSKIRFKEVMKISEISACGKFSENECLTLYRTNQESDWVECSKVFCTFSHNNENDCQMDVRSTLMLKMPLFGLGVTIQEKINNTFVEAVNNFLSQRDFDK